MKVHCTKKPWDVGSLLKLCDVTFRSGDTEDYYREMTEKTKEYMGKSCPISSLIPRTQGAMAGVSGSDRLLAYGTCNEQ